MLHVTNGDAAGDKLARSGLPGQVLPWRDVLHEGPVPRGLAPEELRPLRARFLADRGWGGYEEILADFVRRDAVLARASDHDEVVLWFEHDLYDQLQLVQLLDLLADHARTAPLSLVCIDRHPGVGRFLGLGQLSPAQLAELFQRRVAVTPEQVRLGRGAWLAFGDADPTRLEALLAGDTSALPFLRAALLRHLEQFPWTRTGLGRTEHQVLEAVLVGVRTPSRIFRAVQDLEDAPFLGDSALWEYIAGLCAGPRPLLRPAAGTLGDGRDRSAWEQELALTEDGMMVRRGRADWIELCGGVDRWLGGVHLSGPRAAWRWDGVAGRLVAAT